ncbi:MAG: endonuclease/exonuclease/phosphatase family protein [Bdellovibrionota bacterium]|nr:endonuclease/exonuclease/phosphatase family protein [Bdellovibrionota bacterium]
MKKFSWLFSFVLALTFSALVVGGGRKPAPKPKPKPKPKPPVVSNIKELKLLSYNLGLAHGYVPYAEARLPKLTEELKKSDADILCFQEVWKAEDRTKIINSLKSKYPYSVSAPTKQHHRKTGWFSGPACRVRDLFGDGKFISCILTTCSGKSGEEKSRCINNDCRPALESLTKSNRNCAESLMASVGQNEIKVILNLTNPFKMAPRFSYEGAVGTMIFSKYPFKKSGYIDMANKATLTNRGALYASVQLNGKEHFVGCTHLTANLIVSAPYPNDPPYKKGDVEFENGWENENYFQMGKILEEFKNMAGNNPQYLMGDFNCSIKDMDRGIYPDFEPACKMVLAKGYKDPYSEQGPQCTYCHDNTLLEGTSENEMLLDHVYLKNTGSASSVTSSIKYTEKHSITAEGKTFDSHLSDHYGVQLKVPLN